MNKIYESIYLTFACTLLSCMIIMLLSMYLDVLLRQCVAEPATTWTIIGVLVSTLALIVIVYIYFLDNKAKREDRKLIACESYIRDILGGFAAGEISFYQNPNWHDFDKLICTALKKILGPIMKQ